MWACCLLKAFLSFSAGAEAIVIVERAHGQLQALKSLATYLSLVCTKTGLTSQRPTSLFVCFGDPMRCSSLEACARVVAEIRLFGNEVFPPRLSRSLNSTVFVLHKQVLLGRRWL